MKKFITIAALILFVQPALARLTSEVDQALKPFYGIEGQGVEIESGDIQHKSACTVTLEDDTVTIDFIRGYFKSYFIDFTYETQRNSVGLTLETQKMTDGGTGRCGQGQKAYRRQYILKIINKEVSITESYRCIWWPMRLKHTYRCQF